MNKQIKVIILSLTAMFIFASYSFITRDVEPEDFSTKEVISTIAPMVTVLPIEHVEDTKDVKMFSDEEVEAIVRTLAGECYDDKMADKRKVVEVIVNRVSDGGFGENVIDVVTAKGQFAGYWNQSRQVSESDIQIAEEILDKWYANDCKALSDYLFFRAGPNRENVFRVKY